MSLIKKFVFKEGGASLLMKRIIDHFPDYFKTKYNRVYEKPNKGHIENIQNELFEGGLITNRALIRNYLVNNANGTGDKAVSWKTIEPLFRLGNFFVEEKYTNFLDYGNIVEIERKVITGSRYKKDDSNQYIDWAKQAEAVELKSEEINLLTQKYWVMYRFWEGEGYPHNLKQKNAGIRVSRVDFKVSPESSNELLIRIASLDKPSETKIYYYEGRCYPRQVNGHLYVETGHLTVKGKNDRYLRIIFYFGPDYIDELSTAVYYNVRNHGALLSGSALLLRYEEYPISVESIIYQKWSDIPDSTIRNFFQRKDLNIIKLPNIFPYTRVGLENAIDEYINEELETRIYEFDFFVSIPLTYNKVYKGDYNRNIELSHIAIELFKSRFSYDSYFLANEGKNAEEASEVSNPSRQTTLQALDRCKCLLFIFPYPSSDAILNLKGDNTFPIFTSSALTELGYALGLKKPIYILCDIRMRDYLPSNVKAFNHRAFYSYYTENSITSSLKEAVEVLYKAKH